MAGNMKAVKLRIKSVQSTMQITKAMELVASSKLRKAKERAETRRPYFTELHRDTKRHCEKILIFPPHMPENHPIPVAVMCDCR